MPIDYNLIRVRINLDSIRDNYRMLRSRGTRLIPVIKADAYGHGLIDVARVLASCGADLFAVGTVEEALSLRPAVSGAVLALLGPQVREDFQACAEQDVLPLVARSDQLHLLQEQAAACDTRLPVALKFDTGMARLGFASSDASGIVRLLRRCDRLRPLWLLSHLATADDPLQEPFVREQAERFREIVAAFDQGGMRMRASLVNSAGLLAYSDLAWDGQRPGIALYGANPFHGTTRESLGRGLAPAMEVRAPIIAVHSLPRGASISYGRTYTADRDRIVAIVAAGYADNYSRGLSNKGAVMVRGRRAPVLGRVCMQMTAVDVTGVGDIAPGEQAYLLGGQGDAAVRPEELAAWWGTIPYEVFCLLGMNRRDD